MNKRNFCPPDIHLERLAEIEVEIVDVDPKNERIEELVEELLMLNPTYVSMSALINSARILPEYTYEFFLGLEKIRVRADQLYVHHANRFKIMMNIKRILTKAEYRKKRVKMNESIHQYMNIQCAILHESLLLFVEEERTGESLGFVPWWE